MLNLTLDPFLMNRFRWPRKCPCISTAKTFKFAIKSQPNISFIYFFSPPVPLFLLVCVPVLPDICPIIFNLKVMLALVSIPRADVRKFFSFFFFAQSVSYTHSHCWKDSMIFASEYVYVRPMLSSLLHFARQGPACQPASKPSVEGMFFK